MKVITIKQPFATLIAEGLKEYEFRSWKTQFHGDLLIHAGKSVDKDAMKRFNEQGLEYPLGCIIAKVKMTDCIRVDSNFRKILSEKNPCIYAGTINATDWDGYGFKFENVEKVEPIEINGKLGLWEYDKM